MKSKPMWNAYVVTGKTREECRSRLAEVPLEYRAEVGRHAKTYFDVQEKKSPKRSKKR